jgi:type II secretory pathway pseudopilin PulG
LIIGILAAIALPQFQKVVDKAKITKAVSLIRPFREAVERYYLANGKYPPGSDGTYSSDFHNSFDIQLPVTDDLRYYHHKGVFVAIIANYNNKTKVRIGTFLDTFFLDQPEVAKAYGYDKMRGQIFCWPDNGMAYTPAEEALCKSVCGNDTFKLLYPTSWAPGCLLGKSDW